MYYWSDKSYFYLFHPIICKYRIFSLFGLNDFMSFSKTSYLWFVFLWAGLKSINKTHFQMYYYERSDSDTEYSGISFFFSFFFANVSSASKLQTIAFIEQRIFVHLFFVQSMKNHKNIDNIVPFVHTRYFILQRAA